MNLLAKRLGILFCWFHTLTLAVVFVPEGGIGGLLHKTVEPYRFLTGTIQAWHMFDYMPIHANTRMKIVATNGSGAEETLGPIIPGFSHFDHDKRIRDYMYFKGMIHDPKQEGLLIEYHNRVGAALREMKNQDPPIDFQSFRFDYEQDLILSPEEIRQTGETFRTEKNTLGPFPL